jgi:mRNA interferase MazF
MGTFVKGDVIVVPFPFSDLTQVKRRPALVLAQLNKNNLKKQFNSLSDYQSVC